MIANMLIQDTFTSITSFRFQYFDFKIHARYKEMNSLQGAKIWNF